MSIMAREQVTLTDITDIKEIFRYYCMQESTAAMPSKPTTFPPTGRSYLLWDGDTSGKTVVNYAENKQYVLISECTPLASDFDNTIDGPINPVANNYGIIDQDNMSVNFDDIGFMYSDLDTSSEGVLGIPNVDFGYAVIVIYDGGTEFGGVIFPSAGTYFFKGIPYATGDTFYVSKLSIDKYTGFDGIWQSSEPAYNPDNTYSLYTVDCTLYSDDSFTYSNVSLSSSFEATKVAYNKAASAQSIAEQAYSDLGGLHFFTNPIVCYLSRTGAPYVNSDGNYARRLEEVDDNITADMLIEDEETGLLVGPDGSYDENGELVSSDYNYTAIVEGYFYPTDSRGIYIKKFGECADRIAREAIAKTNADLGGFHFYTNPTVVYLVDGETPYANADGNCILADSAEGAVLLAEVDDAGASLYYSDVITGDFRTVGGADSVLKKFSNAPTVYIKTLTKPGSFDAGGKVIFAGVTSAKGTVNSYYTAYGHASTLTLKCTWEGSTIKVSRSYGGHAQSTSSFSAIEVMYIIEE